MATIRNQHNLQHFDDQYLGVRFCLAEGCRRRKWGSLNMSIFGRYPRNGEDSCLSRMRVRIIVRCNKCSSSVKEVSRIMAKETFKGLQHAKIPKLSKLVHSLTKKELLIRTVTGNTWRSRCAPACLTKTCVSGGVYVYRVPLCRVSSWFEFSSYIGRTDGNNYTIESTSAVLLIERFPAEYYFLDLMQKKETVFLEKTARLIPEKQLFRLENEDDFSAIKFYRYAKQITGAIAQYQTTPLLLEVYATPPDESRDPNQPIANFRCISVAPEEARFSGLPPFDIVSWKKESGTKEVEKHLMKTVLYEFDAVMSNTIRITLVRWDCFGQQRGCRIPQLRVSTTDQRKPQVAARLASRSCQSPTLKKAECGNTARRQHRQDACTDKSSW
ncbi:hypothetical protein WN51_12352 [Melipona quadrifasciata]|uniref:Uncharacterized protein n=1 Tax=Melipona quadrifasciata TaxID=166423 RepID=A0A0N0BHE2_9HYME|nr:hypothetical protein WN51_12352 [Melipona quadrifasciata]